MIKKTRPLLFSGTMLAGIAALGFGFTAHAQQAVAPADAEEDTASQEEIVVTGSRIRRSAATAPAPIILLNRETLLQTGEPNLIDVLADVPALSGSIVPEDTTGANLNDGGLSLLNLRNLGTARTLVLIDGRRHVGAVEGGLQVDVDTIPTLLIEDTEIITGGQSAVYGADAVSGVVNFILRDDFDGIEVDGAWAEINQDGQFNGRISGLIGKNFLNDRANVYFFGEYQDSEEVRDSDVDFRRQARTLLLNDADPTNPAIGPNFDDQLDNIFILGARDIRFNRGGTVVLSNNARPSPLNDPDIPRLTCPTGSANFTTLNAQTLGTNCFGINPETNTVFVFDGPGQARRANFGTFQDQEGTTRPVNVGGDGLNLGTEFAQGSRLPESQAQRYQAGFRFDATRNITAFGEYKYVKEETFDEGQPTFFLGGIGAVVPNSLPGLFGTSNFNVGIDNAFLPAEVRAAILGNQRSVFGAPTNTAPGALTSTVADTRASFNLFGPLRTQTNERELNRFVAGLKGEFDKIGFVSNLNWESSYTFGQVDNENVERGVDVVRFALASDAVVDTAGVAGRGAGAIVCRVQILDALGVAPATYAGRPLTDEIINGCVPNNIFGVDLRQDGFNPAAEQYFNAAITVSHTNIQQNFISFGSAELWDFWGAGPIGVAAGYEWRKEKTGGIGRSSGTAGRLLFLNTGPDFDAVSYDVSEFFGELSIPLLRDSFLGEYAEISGAYRTSDYSTVGNVNVFSLQAQYRPTSDFLFRGTYGESVRIPQLAEQFGPFTQTFFNGAVDPCDSLAIANAAADIAANRRANCVALLNDPNYDPNATRIIYNAGIPGRQGGNPNLQPEESRSFTWSVGYTPSYIPGLSVVIDYYDIKVTEAIATIAPQTALNQCVSGTTLNAQACALFTRVGFIGAGNSQNFNVVDFLNSSLNFAAVQSKGVDFLLNYAFDLQDVVNRNLGEVNYSLRGNYLIRQEDFVNPLDPGDATELDSTLGFPRVRFLSTVAYSPFADWTFFWDWDWQAGQEVFDDELLGRNPDNRSSAFLTTSAFQQHDFTVRYTPTDRLTLRGGVVNAFDQDPDSFLGSGTSVDNFDLFGRRFFIGFNYSR